MFVKVGGGKGLKEISNFFSKEGGGGLGDVALYMTKSETQPKTKTLRLGMVAALMI